MGRPKASASGTSKKKREEECENEWEDPNEYAKPNTCSKKHELLLEEKELCPQATAQLQQRELEVRNAATARFEAGGSDEMAIGMSLDKYAGLHNIHV